MTSLVVSTLSFVDRWFVEPVARRVLRSATPRVGNPAAAQRPPCSASTRTPESGTTPHKTAYSTFTLGDGAILAYEVLGSQYLTSTSGTITRKVVPVVLVCGMTSVRVDFERLSGALVEAGRPVLLYDHRGMGDSTLGSVGEGEMSIESLARDLVELLAHIGWSEVAILGYSMGGELLFYYSSLCGWFTHVDICSRGNCTTIDFAPSSSNKPPAITIPSNASRAGGNEISGGSERGIEPLNCVARTSFCHYYDNEWTHWAPLGNTATVATSTYTSDARTKKSDDSARCFVTDGSQVDFI